MEDQPERVPSRAWVVVFSGMAVNLCLGILYAWSVWKVNLTGGPAGSPMTGLNEGWTSPARKLPGPIPCAASSSPCS